MLTTYLCINCFLAGINFAVIFSDVKTKKELSTLITLTPFYIFFAIPAIIVIASYKGAIKLYTKLSTKE